MKPKIEKIQVDNNNDKRSASSSSFYSKNKMVIILNIAIFVLVTEIILYLLSIIRNQKQVIHNYQLKEQITNMTINLHLFDTKLKDAENQLKAFIYEMDTQKEEKSSLEYKLQNKKEISELLLNSLTMKKRYFDQAKSVSPHLSPKYLEQIESMTQCTIITACYRLSRDGNSAKEFHQRCDGLKPTVTIIYDDTGSSFGGYTQVSWEGNELKYDTKAFLFSLRFDNIFHIRDNQPAINASPLLLPTFGEDDLFVNETISYINEPLTSYKALYGEKRKDCFKLKDIEVFHMRYLE